MNDLRGSLGITLMLTLLARAWSEDAASTSVPLEIPRCTDERLTVTLYADASEIVTPVGAAVDARGR